MQLIQEREEYKLPAGARGMPSWAPKDAKNARGVCAANSSHYIALACVGGAVIEVTLDSGGSRTMIDENTAKLIGLDIEWAKDTNKHYGSFSGVNGKSLQYLGMTKQPVKV
jgi:predicted aspartyl protease